MKDLYQEQGYLYLPGYIPEAALQTIEPVLQKFHLQWLKDNEVGYQRNLLNSHSLTSGSNLSQEDKYLLFRFITQDIIRNLLKEIFPALPLFLNTQLFFDPYNTQQKNYWHRDIQYTGLSTEEQKAAIRNQSVVHFRIPLRKEPGIELIPSTHTGWDLPEEYDTRFGLNGRQPSDPLRRGKIIALNRNDLLVFSANMVHRGLYGQDRFTFDILFCDHSSEFEPYIDKRNWPDATMLPHLNHLFLFGQ